MNIIHEFMFTLYAHMHCCNCNLWNYILIWNWHCVIICLFFYLFTVKRPKMKGWFDAFRDDGAPTLYSFSNRTPVTGDVSIVAVCVLFATIYIAFLVIFPGVRKQVSVLDVHRYYLRALTYTFGCDSMLFYPVYQKVCHPNHQLPLIRRNTPPLRP